VGFIGLGDQGQPMACRIANSERHELSVYARRPVQAEGMMARGAFLAGSVRELARRSEVLSICVSDDAAVQEVLAEAIPALSPGSVIVIHSTIHPDTCKRLAELARVGAIEVIDAPVSGGAQRARDGLLTVMVGGDVSVFASVRPVLETFASTIVHVGDLGAGLTLKLVNNYLFALNREVARQAASVLARLDLDVGTSTAAIAASTGGSECLRRVADAGGVQGLSRHVGGPQRGNALLAKDVALFRDLVSGVGGFSRPADEIIDSGLALAAESKSEACAAE
jgi:3-hydroxyisobutyrate dehydrogenase-like beta-hydroxyacid dehydrogenase